MSKYIYEDSAVLSLICDSLNGYGVGCSLFILPRVNVLKIQADPGQRRSCL